MPNITKQQSKDVSDKITIRVSSDHLRVSLSLGPEFASRPDLIETIRAELACLRIAAPIDEDALSMSLCRLNADPTPTELVIARGITPEAPLDGRIMWTKEFFAHGYYIDPTTNCIDFHRMAATPSIGRDEVIATAILPEPGKPGVDVFGSPIAPAKTKPFPYRAGLNVAFDEKTKVFVAKCDGRVSFDGKVISVKSIYELTGNVGTTSGNIDHNGSVVIKGGIDSEFAVNATGDIEVYDIIGAADIKCGGNLLAHKGISSAAQKKIIVNGNLSAKYLEHATVESDGDIIVELEIIDSNIRTSGRVVCGGQVIGGEIMAATGIQIGEVGCKTRSRTVLFAGIDFRVVNDLRRATGEAGALRKALFSVESKIRKLALLGKHRSQPQQDDFESSTNQCAIIRQQYDELTELRKNLAVQLRSHEEATIEILNQVNPDTVFRIADSVLQIRDALIGPLVARLDLKSKDINLESRGELSRGVTGEERGR